ncbi:MAG: carbon-nitrogen hydrolase [Gammaproteobacteria bacterium]|nr:MAG: carbon-nitrogen hydrolase [Gammaproteobacteria bacterium]
MNKKTNILIAGLVQHGCTNNPAQNLKTSIEGCREAASQGAQLLVLQELHGHAYFCQTENTDHFDLAEEIPGPTSQALGRFAKELGIVIVGSVFERRAAGIYHNTAIVLDSDGRLAGSYRKMHIPDDPGYCEKFYFTPGEGNFLPIDTSLGKLGVLICWDQWYPEAARLMAMHGADVLIYPTAIGWDSRDEEVEQQRQRDSWITIQRAHAIANGIPVISCNRVGFEPGPTDVTPGIHFWGSSFIAGPQGEMLQQLGMAEAGVCVSKLDLKHCEAVRRIWPFFRDRRIDAYGDLSKRYGK